MWEDAILDRNGFYYFPVKLSDNGLAAALQRAMAREAETERPENAQRWGQALSRYVCNRDDEFKYLAYIVHSPVHFRFPTGNNFILSGCRWDRCYINGKTMEDVKLRFFEEYKNFLEINKKWLNGGKND